MQHAVGVERHQHAAEAGVEHVRDQAEQHDRPHGRVGAQVPEPLAQVGDVAGPLPLDPRRRRDEPRDEGGGHDERRGVDQQHVRRAEERDQHAGQRVADHPRAARHGVVRAGRAFQGGARPLGEGGEHRAARGLARRREERPQEDQREDVPVLHADGAVQQRQREHDRRAGQVGADARAPVADPVGERPGERRGQRDGQRRDAGRDAGLGRAAGRLQDEQRDREEGERVAGDRHDVGREQAGQRRAAAHGASWNGRTVRGNAWNVTTTCSVPGPSSRRANDSIVRCTVSVSSLSCAAVIRYW